MKASVVSVKTATANPVTAGETVTYTLAVTNNGPSVARQTVTVTDVIPAGLSWSGRRSATGTDWTCTYTNPDRTVYSIKRFMGNTYEEDAKEIARVPYEVVRDGNMPKVKIGDRFYTPQEISARVPIG